MFVRILRRCNTVRFSALFATADMTVIIEPSFAQVKPTFKIGEEKDPALEAYRRQQEQEYNSVIRQIPEAKKKSSDPWGTVRGVEPNKTQNVGRERKGAVDPVPKP